MAMGGWWQTWRQRVASAAGRLGRVRAAVLLLAICTLTLGWVLRHEARAIAAAALSDDQKYQLVALYSGLTEAPAETADLVPITHTGENPYGVNVFLEQEVEEAKIRRTFEMIKDAGFGWVKQEMVWGEIEIPRKGAHYDEKVGEEDTWRKYDRIVDLANEYGLKLILRLDTSPAWARPGTTWLQTPPDNLADYGDFVYEVVKRYRGRVTHFQIWNEPNLSYEWGNRPVDPAGYVELLKVAYTRAKEANPQAVILAAAMAPTIEDSPRALNDLVFVQRMYEAGAKDWFDIMSANPYGLRSGPDDRRRDLTDDVNFSRPILLRELMVRNGDAHKPIWAAETGWNALPADFPEKPIFGRVAREAQARYTVRAFERVQEEWPWMGVVNVWHFRMAHDLNRDQQMYYFNLVDNDFRTYPVYEALRQKANQAPVVHYGYRQEDSWALDFSPDWRPASDKRAVLGGYKEADSPGARVDFRFQGRDLDLVVARGPSSGVLEVTVDGRAAGANQLPKDADGRAYLDLYSAQDEWQARIPISRGLGDGIHQVSILVSPVKNRLSAGNRAVFDALIVYSTRSSGVPLSGHRLPAAVGGVVALALVGWWLRRRLGRVHAGA